MKFIYSKATHKSLRSFHLLNPEGKPLCQNGRNIELKNRVCLKQLPPGGKICRRCRTKMSTMLLIPTKKAAKAAGQTLHNSPVPIEGFDPEKTTVGSTNLSPKGGKLLMLHMEPAGVTWYFENQEDLHTNISMLPQTNHYDTLKVRN